MSADNPASREAAVEKTLKDFDKCQKMAKTIKDAMSSIAENVTGLIDSIGDGVGEIRKLRDEMESLDNEDKALQKLQKQVEMLECVTAMRGEMEKAYRKLRDVEFRVRLMGDILKARASSQRRL
ncbi:hypothetical protein ACHAPO_002776 [Fusarium lateritium]